MYGISRKVLDRLHPNRRLRFEAYAQVIAAIKSGDLPPITEATECVDCGAPAQEYDHRDYYKPLQVDPVCHKCNLHRGEGHPPVEGDALYYKGVEFDQKGWIALTSAGSDKIDETAHAADVGQLNYERERTDALYAEGMPIYRKIQLSEKDGYVPRELRWGDLRAEYFKQHDPMSEIQDHAV